jgi:ubiquitin-like modifier-activating enzyme ATG7
MAFQSVSSLIEPSFWHVLNRVKLNDKMLDEAPFDITAYFQAGRSEGVKSFVFINQESFEEQRESEPSHFLNTTGRFPVTVHLVNTKNAFKTLDRNGIMESLKAKMFETIKSKEWLKNPGELLHSAFTVFGDLKKWQYTFCFAFPNPLVEEMKADQVTEEIGFEPSTFQYKDWLNVLSDDGKTILPVTEAKADSTLVIVDPATTAAKLGWPVKIACIAFCNTFQVKHVKVIRLNHKPIKCVVEVPDLVLKEDLSEIKFTGWNLTPKKTAHFIDLSATMDPMQLFTSASSLNLRLMKWRMSPGLDVNKLQNQKVLLIGCGTLGCNVARFLLGWGVRKFVLVDYGKVSFSNPPRQSLFVFQDCLNGGKYKAEAAADELKRVCPDVEAEVVKMTIPMPGHALAESEYERVRADVERLDSLIKSVDCTFLLTDTRESRWLPTLLACANDSLCISIALGFDTFSVIRCGPRHLGCYFCNDIIAPTDTMTDRTLDMQCTVTRPGIAPMASSYGVELWASVVQAMEGKDCKADCDCILGTVPHQLRGFLHSWQVLPMSGQPFKCCVACSQPVIDGWKNEGWPFILKALTKQGFLEEISGINAMKAELVDEDCEWED